VLRLLGGVVCLSHFAASVQRMYVHYWVVHTFAFCIHRCGLAWRSLLGAQ
jgi:hypothetical protein